MYLVRIKTKYNEIRLQVEDVNSEEMKELFNQPYIEEVYIESDEHYLDSEIKKYLYNTVGMSYNTEKALELKRKRDE